jgi:hypothetical protein
LAKEAAYWLELLETANFNVFEHAIRKPSHIQVPYKFYQAAKAGKF